jgi:hypothetical protein
LPVGQFFIVWQNGATDISEITPLTGQAADMPKSTRMTPNGHSGYQFRPNVPRPIQGLFRVGVGSCSLSFKLFFETGCADVSVTTEWAAQMLSAGIAFS